MKWPILFCTLFLSLLLVQCASKKDIVKDTTCKTVAMAVDMTGLDGCKILLVLKDGTRLLPAEMPEVDFELENGLQLRINYEVLEDQVSICMAESEIVKITCIEKVNADPSPTEDCIETEKPESVDWMKAALEEHRSFQITRYRYLKGWAYYFQGPNNFLYDCQGMQVCNVPGKMMNDCYRKIQSLGEGTVIWKK
jgi:hypothetical protein